MNPKRTRRRFTAEFKARVALAAFIEPPLAELAARYQLSVSQITRWRQQLREQAAQRALVQASAEGSVVARCQTAGLARSSYYYRPQGETALHLQLMRLLDEEYARHCFKGVLGMRDYVRLYGYPVNEKCVRRLLRLMDL